MISNSTQTREQALLRAALKGAIARASDEHYEDTEDTDESPQWFAKALAESNLKKSQIRNLENVAYTTDKVSDITDLIKKLVGRDTKGKGWASNGIGQKLVKVLTALRASTASPIAAGLQSEYSAAQVDADLTRRIHLELCREYIKHLAAHFLYLRRDQED